MKYVLLPIAALLCFAFVGCQDSLEDAKAKYAIDKHEETLARANVALMLDSASSEERGVAEVDLSDIESFAAAFKDSFNTDKQTAFSEFTYWEGVDESDRKKNMELWMGTKDFHDGLDGRFRGDMSYLDCEEYPYMQFSQVANSSPVVQPTYIIGGYIVNEKDNMTKVSYPVCRMNGRFYISPSVSN